MQMKDGRFVVYGNEISRAQSQKTIRWQEMFARKFNYDPDEEYEGDEAAEDLNIRPG